jgi:DNA-3-methyladenine glycosylase I
MKNRCEWVGSDPLSTGYHDQEWGVPLHDDKRHFEFLILDGAQAGLSWLTILKKRENYREAFDGFEPSKIARYRENKIEKLLRNPGIVRNRLKVQSAVANANAFLKIQDEFGSFDKYIWQFVGGSPIQNNRASIKEIPSKTNESDLMSKDLVKRGFKFAGSTICYAYMQAAGLVNDHTINCFRHEEVKRLAGR